MGQKIKIKKFWRKKNTTRALPGQDEAAEKWKDIAVRAFKTFLQAFLASIPVDAALLGGGWNVLRAALLSAAAAGISALMNFILATLQSEDGDSQ